MITQSVIFELKMNTLLENLSQFEFVDFIQQQLEFKRHCRKVTNCLWIHIQQNVIAYQIFNCKFYCISNRLTTGVVITRCVTNTIQTLQHEFIERYLISLINIASLNCIQWESRAWPCTLWMCKTQVRKEFGRHHNALVVSIKPKQATTYE